MTHDITLVVVAKAVSLALGALVTYFAARAYQRTGSPALRALTVGFALITVGALAAGLIDLLIDPLDRSTALVVESTFTALGFVIILYSLYVD